MLPNIDHWLPLAALTALFGSAMLTTVFAFLYRQYRERHVRTWAWGWALLCLHNLIFLLLLFGWEAGLARLLHDLTLLASGLLLLAGTGQFVQRNVTRVWVGCGVAGGLWIVLCTLVELPFWLETVPIFLLLSAISIWCACLFLRASRGKELTAHFTGWMLIFWGLQEAEAPLLHRSAWLTPWGHLLAGALAFAVAMGMLLTYFQRVRQSLQTSEERFRAIGDYTFDWESWLGTDGRLLWVNAAIRRMTGYSVEEALAMADYPLSLVEAEDRPAIRAALAMVDHGGIIDDQTFRVRRKDGSSVSASLCAQQIFATDGTLLGSRLSIRDVSVLLRYQADLDRQRSLLQTVLETVPAPIFYKDAAGLYLGCNAAFERFLGKSRAEVIGRTVFDLAPPDLAGIYHQADLDLLRRGGTQFYETQVVFADGLRHDVLFSKAVFQREDGTTGGLVGAILDITERKHAELALQESEARYRSLFHESETIFNGIPDSLTVWSSEMRVLWANASSKGVHGEIVGQSCRDLCMRNIVDEGDCEVRRSFASGVVEEGIHRARDGRTWGVKAFPLRNAGGAVDRVIRLASDLTERMVLREEAARSAHLAALGELAAGVAHEINNPTGLILLEMPIIREIFADSQAILDDHFRAHGDFRCGGLKYSRAREEVPAMLDAILDGALRIKQIVEELRDFSHPAEPNRFEPVDLNEVVRKAVSLVANQVKKATAHFTVVYAPEPAATPGNLQRLEQVVLNLVFNACQALPSRERALTIDVGSWPERRRNFIRVTDAGIGILPEHLQLITDPFFTTRRADGGTGLGLSVSTRIIEEHGGTLHFVSTPGEGTVVTVELPMADLEERT